MSGIVGGKNHRGSGLIADLGTDGQIMTSAGLGLRQVFEAAAGGDIVDDTTPQLGGDLDMNAKSLNFEDTNTVSTDPNFLDDYEEGTWTPLIADSSHSQGESQAYNAVYGSYVKIGRRVFIDFYMNINNTGSISGDMYLDGLPFVHNNLAGNPNSAGAYNKDSSALSITAGYTITGRIEGNSTFMNLQLTDAGDGENTQLQVGELTTNGNVGMSGNYETNL